MIAKPNQRLILQARTAMIAAVGAALFWGIGLPLPFLFGPMAACLLTALVGGDMRGLGLLAVLGRTVLGVAIGASVTPKLLHDLPQMALSVALVPIYVFIIGLIGVPFFRRVYKIDLATSWYAAMPGGLQDMVLFGAEAGGNVRTLSLIHATRVLVVVTLAPFILTFGFGQSLSNPVGLPATEIPLTQLGLMAVAAIGGWKIGEKVGLFGATILGPMIATAILSLTGLIHMRPPTEAILSAQFVLGIGIGVGYVGVTLAELRRDVLAGLFFVLILAALAAIMTEIVVHFGLANPVEGFLSFAPGGQAEMTVLAIVSGADLGFVIVHHVTRILVVITGAPVAARLFRLAEKHRKPTGGAS